MIPPSVTLSDLCRGFQGHNELAMKFSLNCMQLVNGWIVQKKVLIFIYVCRCCPHDQWLGSRLYSVMISYLNVTGGELFILLLFRCWTDLNLSHSFWLCREEIRWP